MGIVQSAIRLLDDLADENKNQRPRSDPISSLNSYNHYHHSNTSEVTASPVFTKEYVTPQNAPRRNPVVVSSTPAPAPVGRWIKHYSSCHRILVVGDGDFSFSTSLATSFVWASNMIATSLDSQAFLIQNYENALSNTKKLKLRGCSVMHEIDATTMADHPLLGYIKFDRIIFNFPHAGFFKDLPRQSVIQLHRRLVSLFLKNAKEMINGNGEIHISHKTNGFHKEWNLESLASSHRLRLIEAVDFDLLDYPGYNTKYGFGGDNNFNCYPSKTYKFGLSKWL